MCSVHTSGLKPSTNLNQIYPFLCLKGKKIEEKLKLSGGCGGSAIIANT